MSPEERIAELEEENAWLRSELGIALEDTRVAQVQRNLRLTKSEARLLLSLARSGRVMSKFALVEAMGSETSTRVVDVIVCRIRKQIPDSIQTHWGLGYQITEQGKACVERLS